MLITTDAVGGVGSHTRELARSLVRRRWRVTVAVFGPLPGNYSAAWAGECGVEVRHGGPGLEWMPGAEGAVRESQRWLRAQVAALRPDVLHANQFAAAGAGCGVPVLLAVHSDVVSWWRAVHGRRPPQGPWIRFYELTARAGLAAAAAVVAPTRGALADLRASFGAALDRVPVTAAIANGMDLAAWPQPGERRKRSYAAAAGRLWDEGKQIHLVCQPGLAMPMKIAGPGAPPTAGAAAAGMPPGGGALPAGVSWAGELDADAMKDFLAGAAVFVLPSRYEPFGLGALEAALSGCALLLNDIPSLREVWG
ncbi:MAG: glycosyltransferase family 4 protein, partial [Terriglobales bacterium]